MSLFLLILLLFVSREYSVVGEPQSMAINMEGFKGMAALGYNMVSTEVEVHEEVYQYPTLSYIAEFGGSLGLFLGASFISVWDFVDWGLRKKEKISF